MKTISFIKKLPFRQYLLCSKPVKPGHYSVLPSHILRVLLTKYGKMTQYSGIINEDIYVSYHSNSNYLTNILKHDNASCFSLSGMTD